MEMATLQLESFGEPPKACVTNSSHPLANLKEKGNQICQWFVQTIGLLMWHNLCFNHLVPSTFQQCSSAINPEVCQAHSQHPTHSTVPLEKTASLMQLRTMIYSYCRPFKLHSSMHFNSTSARGWHGGQTQPTLLTPPSLSGSLLHPLMKSLVAKQPK